MFEKIRANQKTQAEKSCAEIMELIKRAPRHTPYWWAKRDAQMRYEKFLKYSPKAPGISYTERYLRTLTPFERCYAYNPLTIGVCVAMDIGVAMKLLPKANLSPEENRKKRKELVKAMRKLRRSSYYEAENMRRRKLAEARRKIRSRSTTAPQPEPEEILEAWNRRKESKESMIRLGGLLHDLECYVDNRLKIDENGRIIGRQRGIRGWLTACLPELLPHYKRLMQYKAMAIRLRQATNTKDPKPTENLLTETPRHPAVKEILELSADFFSGVMGVLEKHLEEAEKRLEAWERAQEGVVREQEGVGEGIRRSGRGRKKARERRDL